MQPPKSPSSQLPPTSFRRGRYPEKGLDASGAGGKVQIYLLIEDGTNKKVDSRKKQADLLRDNSGLFPECTDVMEIERKIVGIITGQLATKTFVFLANMSGTKLRWVGAPSGSSTHTMGLSGLPPIQLSKIAPVRGASGAKKDGWVGVGVGGRESAKSQPHK